MAEEFEGVLRVRNWSRSWVIVLPRELREFFGVVHRDMLAYRKVGRLIVLRRIRAGELLPVTDAEAKEAAGKVGE
jgi:bifunctional DNA-binding transcriptional regulator/antitoxin component of YhaV-PrlF toxin-antitoxin module